MKRAIADLLIGCVPMLCGSTCVSAQGVSVDQFLQGVSAHPVGDKVEQDRSREIYRFLASAPSADVKREILTVLKYTLSGNDIRARRNAVLFLTAFAIRPDGADLLSANSGEISSLIVDSDPGVQSGALTAMEYVIAKPATNKQPYLSALQTAIRQKQTPQDAGEQMILPLLIYDGSDPAVVKSVRAFMQRDDLTRSTRSDLVSHLGDISGLPTEVNQALIKELDDPDPWVRTAAVVAFADSTSEFHTLAKDRVARMANDAQENAQVREKAKDAIAGKTHLDPNIDWPHEDRKDH